MNKIIKILRIIFSPFLIFLVPVYYLLFLIKKYFDIKRQVKLKGTKVICVGNYNLGGSGKTVFVEKIAESLKKANKNIVIISRGYKREKKSKIIFLKDSLDVPNVKLVGDEPMMLFENLKIPIIVGRNKKDIIKEAAERFNPQIIISDDGYQNWTFYKDINLLIINLLSENRFDFLLPLGNLREPRRQALKRADYIILNHVLLVKDNVKQQVVSRILKYNTTAKIIETSYQIKKIIKLTNGEKYDIIKFKSQYPKVLLFNGIAEPKSFRILLEMYGFKIFKQISFDDHHWYSKSDIENIARFNLVSLTTRKDAVKINAIKNSLGKENLENIFFVELGILFHKGEDYWKEMLNIM